MGRWGAVEPSGSARMRRIRFYIFFEIIFQCKTNSGKTQKMFKVTKILRKFKNFQETSQRQIETRTIQIKYLVLMKKIL
jgi:hypothetical protein